MKMVRSSLAVIFLAAHALGVGAGEIKSFYQEELERFTPMLKSANPGERIQGVAGLSGLKHFGSEERIISLLQDPDEEVRLESIRALGRIGTAKSFAALAQLQAAKSWQVRNEVALVKAQFQLEPAAKDLPAERSEKLISRINGLTNVQERVLWISALKRWAESKDETAVIKLLTGSPAPPLTPKERALLCETLERIGSAQAIPVLARERSDAAAWALGGIGGAEAEQALLKFRKTFVVMLNLDRFGSTNCGTLLPHLVHSFGLITYRAHPEDLHLGEPQPVQRVAAKLIERSGRAPELIEATFRELEKTMQPPVTPSAANSFPEDITALMQRLREELKPGFVRGDGETTSQPLSAMHLLAHDPDLSKRLRPLLHHPAFVARIYVAMTLCKLRDAAAEAEIIAMIRAGYPFSDATALASGKHFDQSQTIRWRGFLCMALGKAGSETAREALESFAADPAQPRDVRYGAVVGLGFSPAAQSRPALERVAAEDQIWMIRDEASRILAKIETSKDRSLAARKESP